MSDAGVTGAREGLPFTLTAGVPFVLSPCSIMVSVSRDGDVLVIGTAGGGMENVVERSTGDGVEFGTSPTGSITAEGCGLGSGEPRE